MMDEDWKLKVQACLDGELPAQEARRAQERAGKDLEAQQLLKELEGANALLAAFEREIRVPESREFYWSRIQRAISAGGPVASRRSLWLTRWWKLLLPAAATTALVLVFALSRSGPGYSSHPAAQSPLAAQAQPVQCAIADPAALTYEDYNAGATLVWFSYPPEKELAANR
jgi:hypothetical protein